MRQIEERQKVAYLDKLEAYVSTLEKLVVMTEQMRSPAERDKLSEDELAQALVLVDVCNKLTKKASENIKAALNVVLATGVVLELPEYQVTVEKRVSAPKKDWKHEQLISVVSEAILEQHRDKEFGTIDTPYAQLMAEMFDYASVGYWRIKKLKELGIPVEDFCETGESKTSFSIGRATIERKNEDDDFI